MHVDPLHPHAIPLFTCTGHEGGYRIGTGSLVYVDELLFLVTVAHLGTGLANSTYDWTSWSPTLRTILGAEQFEISLFTESGSRDPRFSYLPLEGSSRVLDLIAIPVSKGDAWATAYTPLTLDLSAPKYLGAQVFIAGYPDLGSGEWPGRACSTSQGPITRISPNNYPFDVGCSIEEGQSGAPVLDLSGRLLGIAFGTGDVLKTHQDARVMNIGFLGHPQMRVARP